MINIRLGMWETNSSSAHQIIQTTEVGTVEPLLDPMNPESGLEKLPDGSLHISDYSDNGEWGPYPSGYLTSFDQKLMYAGNDLYRYRNWEAWSSGDGPNFAKEAYDALADLRRDYEDILEKYFGTRDIGFLKLEYAMKTGYESDSIVAEALKTYHVTLEEFLTQKRFVVVIDGDEYYWFYYALTRGLIDKDRLVHYDDFEDDEMMADIADEAREIEEARAKGHEFMVESLLANPKSTDHPSKFDIPEYLWPAKYRNEGVTAGGEEGQG